MFWCKKNGISSRVLGSHPLLGWEWCAMICTLFASLMTKISIKLVVGIEHRLYCLFEAVPERSLGQKTKELKFFLMEVSTKNVDQTNTSKLRSTKLSNIWCWPIYFQLSAKYIQQHNASQCIWHWNHVIWIRFNVILCSTQQHKACWSYKWTSNIFCLPKMHQIMDSIKERFNHPLFFWVKSSDSTVQQIIIKWK